MSARHHHVSWRRRTVIAILIYIAKLVSDDQEITRELTVIGNHIAAGDLDYEKK